MSIRSGSGQAGGTKPGKQASMPQHPAAGPCMRSMSQCRLGANKRVPADFVVHSGAADRALERRVRETALPRAVLRLCGAARDRADPAHPVPRQPVLLLPRHGEGAQPAVHMPMLAWAQSWEMTISVAVCCICVELRLATLFAKPSKVCI